MGKGFSVTEQNLRSCTINLCFTRDKLSATSRALREFSRCFTLTFEFHFQLKSSDLTLWQCCQKQFFKSTSERAFDERNKLASSLIGSNEHFERRFNWLNLCGIEVHKSEATISIWNYATESRTYLSQNWLVRVAYKLRRLYGISRSPSDVCECESCPFISAMNLCLPSDSIEGIPLSETPFWPLSNVKMVGDTKSLSRWASRVDILSTSSHTRYLLHCQCHSMSPQTWLIKMLARFSSDIFSPFLSSRCRLFEEHYELIGLFEKFKELKTREEQSTSEELAEHAIKVMETLDEGIRSLDELDVFFQYLHDVGASHRRIPTFKSEYFWVSRWQR